MKTRFLAIIALTLLCSASAIGQEKDYKYEREWFGTMGAGMNFGVTQWSGKILPADRSLSGMGAGTALDASFGRRFSDFFGMRVGYHGLDISDGYTRYGAYNYHYGHADAILMRSKYVMPYLHAGYLMAGQNLRAEKGRAAGGAGVMVPIHLTRRISIVPDIKLTLFDGSALRAARKVAGNVSVSIGVGINLASPRAKVKKEVEYIVSPPDTVIMHQVDTVVVKERVVDTVYVGISEHFTERIAGVTLFDFDRYNLRSEAFPVLDEIAQWLRENPERTMLIEGYTDQRGTDAYNKVLSQNRAEAVRNYLVKAGIAPHRITALGRGKGDFKIGHTTEEVHQQNRRTVITVK